MFSFAKNKSISVQVALTSQNFSDLLHLPLSQEALAQFQELTHGLEQMVLSEDINKWSYVWGSTSFSSTRIYKELVDHPVVDQAFRWLWRCPCQPKHKVFLWLLLKDRLSTRNILRRRHMNLESYNCVLCTDSMEETLEHLFLRCTFARQCWNLLGITVPQNYTFSVLFQSSKSGCSRIFSW